MSEFVFASPEIRWIEVRLYILMTFGGLPWPKLGYFGGNKYPFGVSKMPKCANIYFLAPTYPQSHLVVSHDQTLHIWRMEKGPFGGQKWQNLPKLVVAPNAPKSHLGVFYNRYLGAKNAHFGSLLWPIFGSQKCPFWGAKMPKCANIYFFAPKFIWWSPMTKFCLFGGWKKAYFGGQKWQNVPKLFLAPNAPKCHLGVSHE